MMMDVKIKLSAAWPSGKAGACKALTPSSNLGAAFIKKTALEFNLRAVFFATSMDRKVPTGANIVLVAIAKVAIAAGNGEALFEAHSIILKPPVSTIQNLSASAHLVAFYRALESERPDALFQDPYARMLAGTLGVGLAETIGYSDAAANMIAVRTRLIDTIILDLLSQDRVETIISLGAGLDTRPYRLSLPQSLRWIEIDQPELLSYKEERLRSIKPVCTVEHVKMDLNNIEQRHSLFESLNLQSPNVLILSEGLLAYFSPAQVAALAQDLSRHNAFHWWLFELMSLPAAFQPSQGRSLHKQLDRHVGAGRPAFQFLPEKGTQFFGPYGWRVAKSRSMLDEIEQLKRASCLIRLWKPLSRWIYGESWQVFSQRASVVLMERIN
jgi:methyltransferase (TIGR00027 family)